MGRIKLNHVSGVISRRRRLTTLVAGVAPAILLASCGGAVSSAQPLLTGSNVAYVTNQNGIVPFNLETHSVGRLLTPPSWNQNDDLLVAANGRTGFVVEPGGYLIPLNLVTGSFGTPITKSFMWDAFALTPDGHTIWVTNSLVNGGEGHVNAIAPFSTLTGKLGKPIPVPDLPVLLNLSPDGMTAYVQTSGGANLTVVSLSTGVVGPVFQIPDGVGDLAISPGGQIAWATGSGGSENENCQNSCITPIDLVDGVTGTPIALIHAPYGIVLSPDAHTAYVTGGEAGPPAPPDVTEIDLSSGKVTGTFSIPGGSNGIVNATS